MTIKDDIKRQFQQGDTILRLIIINVAIFLLVHLIHVPFFLMGFVNGEYEKFIADWFYLPSNLYQLVTRPWTLITYMFFHVGVLHILFNMLMLFWFGRVLTNLGFNNKILGIYVWGGIIGGLLFILAYNIFPVFRDLPPIVGASAGVMAVVLAAATKVPRASMQFLFIGRVELQYFALFLVLLDIIFIPGGNPGGRFAHLGGALMGWFFMFQLHRGRDFSKPVNATLEFLMRPFTRRNELTSAPLRRRPQPRVAFGGGATTKQENANDERAGQTTQMSGYSRLFVQTYRNMSREECVDAILDKIRRTGYNSLTEDEKAFLDKSSRDED